MFNLSKVHWLDMFLSEVDMTQAELSRVSGIDSGTLSNIRNGKRRMGMKIAAKLAKATKRKVQDVLMLAGELKDDRPDDQTFDRIEGLYNSLKHDASKERALEFIKYLSDQEDKDDRTGKKSK